MFSIQQLIKALRRLESNSADGRADLVKSLKQTIGLYGSQIGEDTTAATLITSITSSANIQSNSKHVMRELREQSTAEIETASALCADQTKQHILNNLNSQNILNYTNNNNNNNNSCNISDKSSQATTIFTIHQTNRVVTAATATATHNSCSHSQAFSNNSYLYENGPNIFDAAKQTPKKFKENIIENIEENCSNNCHHPQASKTSRSQRIQNFYQQQLYHFHTHNSPTGNNKQRQTHLAVMASLATEQLSDQSLPDDEQQFSNNCNESNDVVAGATSTSSSTISAPAAASAVSCGDSHVSSKPCFNAGLSDILKFMELIGNLKHIKRTGWVLRDVNDCESISGHMYRMSILTFLLDGSEGLNQTRCMELALVHDLAESLVGDITPFCGVSKVDKRAMEFKAMEDICKLIEPRGKRIMELFEEYELGESAESQFVKDLDRLDMVMQAFEYEKRDNCLLKHQEFFDSTAGKFKHPFVKKLINEIYEQRNKLAKAKGAILPPKIDVPSMEVKSHIDASCSNGHCSSSATTTTTTTTVTSTSNNNTTTTS